MGPAKSDLHCLEGTPEKAEQDRTARLIQATIAKDDQSIKAQQRIHELEEKEKGPTAAQGQKQHEKQIKIVGQ
jgi:hypothetical protein